MLDDTQPSFELEIMNDKRLIDAFGRTMSSFTLVKPNPGNSERTTYIAATRDGELAGLAKIYDADTNQALEGIEVREEFQNQGCGKTLKDAVFRYAAEHTGALLLSPRTDMGKKRLARYDDELKRKFPSLYIAHDPGC